ncbi:hypothetical protein KKC06_03645 [Patescibacteria group bacterium]|nr:hypothetical protein [Patescibacteria group bacterium]
MSSEYKCGNCEEEYEIDENGKPIQECPNCHSPEVVKGFKDENKGGEK